jgi:very-short-patch-repair endonuclease
MAPTNYDSELPIDRAVARVAFRQHGLVTSRQIEELGVSREAKRARLRRGQWAVAERGVLRIEGAQITWESSLLTKILAVGDAAMASHRSAAALWHLDECRRGGKPELVTPRTQNVRRADAIVHRSTDIGLVEPVMREGIPTTPIERTLLDLGAVVSRQRHLIAIDSARRRRLTDWNRLLTALVRHARRGRNGVGALRSILEDHYGELATTDSAFERLVMIRLAEAGLPPPVLQHEVTIGDSSYRIDLAYPKERVAIELDGQVHLRKNVWEQDHRRQNVLIAAGWHLLRYTWAQFKDHPATMVREIRTALTRNR